MLSAGQYLEAAETAIELELEVTNSGWRYTEADAKKALVALDPIIEKCELALSGRRDARPPSGK